MWVRLLQVVILGSVVGTFLYARAGHDLRHSVIGNVLGYCFAVSALLLVATSFAAPSLVPSSRTVAADRQKPDQAAGRERRMIWIGVAMIGSSLLVIVGGSLLEFEYWGEAAPKWAVETLTGISTLLIMIGILLLVQAIYSAARR
jgi:hypothetical protein